MVPWTCTPDLKYCVSDSLVQLVPTCIIVFSSLAVISAECGRQDRTRMFDRFSSEVVVAGESQSEMDVDTSNSTRLIKPKRTFPLAILRVIGAFVQIGLFTFLAFQKLADLNQNAPPEAPRLGAEVDEDWPLWLPVMHGIVWVYAAILSIVSLLHPRLSHPYKLITHLDIIYLTTGLGGLAHFMQNNFGRPIGLWTLDDQVSGLSALVSTAMGVLTLATKPLVPPQPNKGPEKRSKGVISPETRSSLYAQIAFTWLHPMVIKAFTGRLQETDVWAMDRALRIKTVFQDYIENRKATVFFTMLSLFRLELAQQYIWAAVWAALGLVPPFVVFKLVQFSQDISTYNRNEALFYIAALLVSIIVRSAVLQRGLHLGQRLATKAMGMTSGLVYEKMSVRKDMDPHDYDMSDLATVDVKHIGQGWKNVFYIMAYPTMFVMAVIQLHGYIGHSAWAGGLAVIAWYPISALASFLFSGRFDPAPVKMERSNALVTDLLTNLKAIKYLGWEDILMSKVLKAREEERHANSKTSPAVMTLISVPLGGDLVHAFVVVVVLAVFSQYYGKPLTPAILFTTLISVDIQTDAINSLPLVIIALKEMLTAVVRVNDFLADDENDRDTVIIRDRELARRANIPVIGFVDATFVWPEAKPMGHGGEVLFVDEPDMDDQDDEVVEGDWQSIRNRKTMKSNAARNTNWIIRTLSLFGYSLPTPPPPYQPPYGRQLFASTPVTSDFSLKGITLSFPPNHLSLVTGTKKSGKSALLLALIGEMTRTSGKIYLPRKDYYHNKQGYGSDVAYVAQDPWLEIGGAGGASGNVTGRSTIRDTILFGQVMDEQRYTEVLRACVLEHDLNGLPHGDMTIIGDKGVIWSMSLKQRISLARAVYSDVSHILMDDCLSFVDVKSRHFIWKNCLLGPLMENKTRIMVSNQFHIKTYLNDVDYVVGLDQGVVLGHGTVRDVLSQGWIRQAPGSSIPTTIIPGASVPSNLGQPRVDPQQPLSDSIGNAPVQELRSSKSTNLPLNKLSSLSDYDDLDSTLSRETAAGLRVGWMTFGTYIFSSGTALFLWGAFVSLLLSQVLFVIRIGWLGIWAENASWDGDVPSSSQHYALVTRNRLTLEDPPAGRLPREPMTNYDYLTIFIALAGVRALFVIGNALFLRSGAHTGADRIYERLLRSVTSARLNVFEPNNEKAASCAKTSPDTTATATLGESGGLFAKGTINSLKECFQRDLDGLDVKLAKEFWQFSSDFMSVTLIITMLAVILPFILVPTAVVFFMLSSVAILGLGLSKEMHRMAIRADRMDKDQFKHTFRGLATIRGYGLERRAIKAGIAQAEVYLKTTYFGSCADRWLHWKVELLSAFIPFSVAVLVLQRIEDLDPVLIGLCLYLSLQFSDKVLNCLLGYGRIRNRLQWALERTRRYIRDLNLKEHKEAPRVVPAKQPPAGWPHSGAVEFLNYSCSRSESISGVSASAPKITNQTPIDPDQVEIVQVLARSGPDEPPPQQQLQQQQQQQQMLQDLAMATPLDNGSVRTNTAVSGVSTANTVMSGTSHLSAASRASMASNTTAVNVNGHGQALGYEASIATLVPAPTPVIMSSSAIVAAPAVPIDQLQALNQMDARDKKFDSPLPPLPPVSGGSSAPAGILKKNDSVNGAPVATTTTAVGFGPVTCTVRSGEKIAVVGQSKSGKSTFIQSLFRIWDSFEEDQVRTERAAALALTDPNNAKAKKKPLFGGNKAKKNVGANPDLGLIKVDGLDIHQMGLSALRSRLGILSQRGTIFAGTVRFNLDPQGEHEDAELNDILKICFLSDRIKLDTELITPATANLSVFVSSSNTPAKPLKISRRKHFFRRSRAAPKDLKGKSKTSGYGRTAPATVGPTSGRGLRATVLANGGGRNGSNDLSEIDQRLLETLEEGPEESSSSDEDGENDDDNRVELDTNERQLLSLARILVQRPNIVVLDNCASKVTDLTAQRIDQIVMQELRHATVLSVGHRLDQIVARHNRILVLEHGKIVEFDTPMALLMKPDGAFRSICNPNGPNFSALVSLAKRQQLQQ
ncbi:hypothetical protein MVEG_08928 [Podila verticillata NRRL 6337]|nr:hypothetical protein MVEG_08928 [Podila verticillata NRRL 6337]